MEDPSGGLDPLASRGFYRLACERCRNHKLRCTWSSPGADASCERCTRAHVQCEKNNARRVGRPPRLPQTQRRHPPRLVTPSSATTTQHQDHQRHQHDQGQTPFTPQDHITDLNHISSPESNAPDLSNFSQLASVQVNQGNGNLDIRVSPPGNLSGTGAGEDTGPGQGAGPHHGGVHAVGGIALTPETTPDIAFDVRADTGWVESLLAQAPTQNAALVDASRPGTNSTLSRPRDSSPTYHLADSQAGDFDSSSAATNVSHPGPHGSAATHNSATESDNPDGLREQRKQLAALNVELLELLPVTSQQQQVRADLWILLVPKVIAHMKFFQRLADGILSADPTRAYGLGSEDAQTDKSTWMVLMACYLRIIQVCRYSFASIRVTLETNRGLFARLHVEGAMMPDDEPNLKVLLLLQVLKYRLNAIATILDLPDHHRFGGQRQCLADQYTIPTGLHTVATVIDWVLQGDLRERSVFGSPTARKSNITEALKAEMGVLRTMVS